MSLVPPADPHTPARWRPWLAATALLALLALGAAPRLRAAEHAGQAAADQSITPVRTVAPSPPQAGPAATLPGTLEPWAEASVRARSSGYVAAWSVDIGAHVVAGQTLATLVAPDLQAALDQARATAATARANLALAQTTADRWQALLRTRSTSPQEADQKLAELAARRTELAAAEANAARLAQSVAWTRIAAPFDGVVTARDVDVGSLVDAGGAGELFHVAQTTRLRAVVSVPDALASGIRPGLPVQVRCGERLLDARVARSAGALDLASRALRVEVDVPNADGALLPGQFVQVLVGDVPPAGSQLPIEALLFRPSGPTIALAGADGRVHLRTVHVARDLGTRVVVEPALPPDTRVIVSPGDGIVDGTPVRAVGAAS